MASHSSTPAWKIWWTEEPGRLQSIGSQRVRHDSVTTTTIKAIRDKPTANVILSRQKLNNFRLRSGWTKVPTLTISMKLVLEVLTRAVTQEKEIKAFQLERKKLNCLCLQMTWYHTKETLNISPRTINKFSKVARYKKIQKSVLFLYTNQLSEKEEL